MKKFIMFTMSVLLCTSVFANGTDDPASEASTLGVTNANGSKLVKVYYKTPHFGNVKIAIFNDHHRVVYTERVKKTNGFMRPYNFEGLKEGEYTIEISDALGKYTEKVNYLGGKIKTLIHFSKVPGEEKRFVLTGRSHNEDKLRVRFYDSSRQMVFDELLRIDGEFGQVYNLKMLPGSFTVEISDSQGLLKTVSY